MTAFKAFAQIIKDHAHLTPKSIACIDVDLGKEWSWKQMNAAIERLTDWFIEQFGGSSCDRVATLSKNKIELLIIQHACARAGLVYLPINWRLSTNEISYVLDDCKPKLLFCETNLSSSQWVVDIKNIDDCLSLTASKPITNSQAALGLDEPMTILYTSGTSGRPKGVMLSSNNVGAGAENFISANHVTKDTVFLCDMPLFHTAGLFASAGVSIQAGAKLLISQGFDPSKTIARLSDESLAITHYFSVPQMAQMLRNHADFIPEKFRYLQVYSTGGAPNPPSQVKQFVESGILMSDGYGMSEICSTMGVPFDDPAVLISKAGSCGILYKHSQARIVDDEGNDLPPGHSGELWIKSPTVTQGYWNQPTLSSQAFEEGWFKTGDIAKRDEDGFYYLVDRKKDMFISGGENVYPAEIENTIAELAQVAQCAVIGTPNEKWGEVGRAYVAPVKGKTIAPEDIINHCKKRLAGFKVPKSVHVLDVLPSTGSGKIQKHLLPKQE